MEREKVSTLDRVDLVPMSKNSVLLLFNFRKLEVNHDFISERQEVRERGGSVELGLQER